MKGAGMSSHPSLLRAISDNVHCPVCLELYNNPQALQCLHTFCSNCVNKFTTNSNEVACPSCRNLTPVKNIMADFKTKKLVEIFMQQAGLERQEENICVLCEEKPPEYICKSCDRYLCATCCKIHIKTTNCKLENAEKIKDVNQHFLNMLEVHSQGFQAEKGRLTKLKAELSGSLKQCSDDCMKVLDKSESKMVAEVKKWFKQQKEVLREKQEKKQAAINSKCDEQLTIAEGMLRDIIKLQKSTNGKPTKHPEAIDRELQKELQKLQQVNLDPERMMVMEEKLPKFSPQQQQASVVVVDGETAQSDDGQASQITRNGSQSEPRMNSGLHRAELPKRQSITRQEKPLHKGAKYNGGLLQDSLPSGSGSTSHARENGFPRNQLSNVNLLLNAASNGFYTQNGSPPASNGDLSQKHVRSMLPKNSGPLGHIEYEENPSKRSGRNLNSFHNSANNNNNTISKPKIPCSGVIQRSQSQESQENHFPNLQQHVAFLPERQLYAQRISQLSQSAYQLQMVHDQLWVLMDDKIEVLDDTGNVQRCFKPGFTSAIDMCVTEMNHVIVASYDTGLFQLDGGTGEVIRCIDKGKYFSVTRSDEDDTIIALKEEPGWFWSNVWVYRYNNRGGSFREVSKVATSVRAKGCPVYSVEMDDKLYISGCNSDKIHVIDPIKGQTLAQHGSKGKKAAGELWGPTAVYADSISGSLLVVDNGNNRLQLYEADFDRWSVIDIEGEEVSGPMALALDLERGVLWAAAGGDTSTGPYTLYKCTV